ncbi:hypothetical protein MAR_004024 [Mya arenaria]|uniref:Uncharacterized protein n=1 Tax=Mya arenaria TaxID=6604 RepID=A0ABY7EX94_MYAAR|nr:hypothetical protein MAR_003997 [Mya arenaria]WAR13919.1 hypothetical protein MAR_004024 [Mya arenaria]
MMCHLIRDYCTAKAFLADTKYYKITRASSEQLMKCSLDIKKELCNVFISLKQKLDIIYVLKKDKEVNEETGSCV